MAARPCCFLSSSVGFPSAVSLSRGGWFVGGTHAARWHPVVQWPRAYTHTHTRRRCARARAPASWPARSRARAREIGSVAVPWLLVTRRRTRGIAKRADKEAIRDDTGRQTRAKIRVGLCPVARVGRRARRETHRTRCDARERGGRRWRPSPQLRG